MLPRMGFLLVILAVLELAYFDWQYKDLVYLSRPKAILLRAATGDFRTHSEHALQRPTLTRGVLETIAETAALRDDEMIVFPALRRLEDDYPRESAALITELRTKLRAEGHNEEGGRLYRKGDDVRPVVPKLFPD